MRVIERSMQEAGPGQGQTVRFTLDLEELQDYPTNRLPGFTDDVLALLPGLREHRCPDGATFFSAMSDGMCIAVLVEHVIRELLALAGSAPPRGEVQPVDGRPGLYAVLCPCGDEAAALTAARMALELIASLLPPDHRAVLGLGLLAPPIEGTDADCRIPGMSALRRMVAGPVTGGAVTIVPAALDLLAPVDLLAPAELLANRPLA